MRTIAKLAHLGTTAGRMPLDSLIRRVLDAAAERRTARPLKDLDDWSDQAEVAFYENCRASRS